MINKVKDDPKFTLWYGSSKFAFSLTHHLFATVDFRFQNISLFETRFK